MTMTFTRALKPVPRQTVVRSRIAGPLAVLGAVNAGLLAGGMVLIEVVLVPFWRGTSPTEFRGWFTTHSGRIRSVMRPLGAGGVLLTAASAATQVGDGRRPGAASV